MASINQNAYPYVIVSGAIEEITQIAVSLIGVEYYYPSIKSAFEALCKTFYAILNLAANN